MELKLVTSVKLKGKSSERPNVRNCHQCQNYLIGLFNFGFVSCEALSMIFFFVFPAGSGSQAPYSMTTPLQCRYSV